MTESIVMLWWSPSKILPYLGFTQAHPDTHWSLKQNYLGCWGNFLCHPVETSATWRVPPILLHLLTNPGHENHTFANLIPTSRPFGATRSNLSSWSMTQFVQKSFALFTFKFTQLLVVNKFTQSISSFFSPNTTQMEKNKSSANSLTSGIYF